MHGELFIMIIASMVIPHQNNLETLIWIDFGESLVSLAEESLELFWMKQLLSKKMFRAVGRFLGTCFWDLWDDPRYEAISHLLVGHCSFLSKLMLGKSCCSPMGWASCLCTSWLKSLKAMIFILMISCWFQAPLVSPVSP